IRRRQRNVLLRLQDSSGRQNTQNAKGNWVTHEIVLLDLCSACPPCTAGRSILARGSEFVPATALSAARHEDWVVGNRPGKHGGFPVIRPALVIVRPRRLRLRGRGSRGREVIAHLHVVAARVAQRLIHLPLKILRFAPHREQQYTCQGKKSHDWP